MVGQRKGITTVDESLRESEEDDKKILNRLGRTLFFEQENHFRSYWSCVRTVVY
jgi:hypothetical protein